MAKTVGVFRGLDTVLMRVRDIDVAKRWYVEKLGFAEPYFDPAERLAVFDLDGTTSLTLWELKPDEPPLKRVPFASTNPIGGCYTEINPESGCFWKQYKQ